MLSSCLNLDSSPVEDIIAGRKVKYEREEYQESKELQYPPDIITDARQVESQLLSEYRIASVPTIITEENEVPLDSEHKVSYQRDGNLRWINVDLSAGETWVRINNFWKDLGFPLYKEDPRLGTIETDWLDLRQDVASPGLGSLLDNILNRVRDSGKRDKFVTRIEGSDEQSSVFIAHRHLAAQFNKDGFFSNYEPLPADAQLEAEMLRRMMIYFAGGDKNEIITEEIATAEAIEKDYVLEETQLRIKKTLEESWLLVRIGLDRGGFTINDRDYVELAYYISHSGGPESNKIFSKVETSFFNKLFGEEKPILRDIKLTLRGDGNDTIVEVLADDDDGDLTVAQSSVLLELISINLP
jgi:outer membrane protein assembly factor BamC